MITKGIIRKITTSSENGVVFDVRLPLFETASDPTEFILPSRLCYQPGNLEGYSVGDIVYVGFESEYLSKPVILGKLYKGNEKKLFENSDKELTEEDVDKRNASNFSYNRDLEVIHSAILPNNTQIGKLSYTDIYDMYKTIQTMETRLIRLENQLNLVYDEQIPAIESATTSITVADLEGLAATPDGSDE